MNEILLICAIQAVVGAALAAPILYLGRRRARWAKWQLLGLVVPYSVWVLLMVSPLSEGRKSLANLGEPLYISFAMPIAALLRVSLGRHVSERTCAVGLIGALSLLAAAVFFMVPLKPE
jgi:hypothetical protein